MSKDRSADTQADEIIDAQNGEEISSAEVIEEMDGKGEKPKETISELLRVRKATEQIKAHKSESILAFVGFVVLSLSQMMIATQFTQVFPQILDSTYVPLLEAVVSTALALTALILLALAAIKIARPLKKRIVLLRLALLTLALLFVTAVKSLALGHLARLLFAEDPTRFELAKTGVDHASGLLGVIVAALFYTFLAACLRESKIEFKNFFKAFGVLTIWIAVIYVIKFVLSSALSTYLFNVSVDASTNSTLITILTLISALVVLFLTAFTTLWYVAVALSFYEKDDGELQCAEDSDTQDDDWDTDDDVYTKDDDFDLQDRSGEED